MANNLPWIEKYRPKHLEELELERSTQNKINKIIKDKDMPNLIITGVPGIGKTTTIQCIARGLYGKYMRDGVIELNASDDRGIKIVHDTLINFCKKKLELNKEGKKKRYSDHKLIILDEADNMTSKAQRLINNLMEKYHKTTRFAFTCNTSSDIIESIQSRCIIFRYFRLNKEKVLTKLKMICNKENIKYEEDAIIELSMLSMGDLRHGINNLQLIYNAYVELKKEHIYKICDKPQPIYLQTIIKLCVKKDLIKILEMIEQLKQNGYSGSDIILGMMNILKYIDNKSITEENKIIISNSVNNTAYIISRGIDTNLQLTGCFIEIILNIK
jgi:replication factor C subunit 2/4